MFGEFAYLAVQNAYRLYLNSKQNVDVPLKVFLLSLSLEELSKPLLLAELVPPLNSKNSTFKKEYIDYLDNHSAKHFSIGVYGETYSNLNYNVKLSDAEIEKLETIKQQCIYSDVKNNKAVSPLQYFEKEDIELLGNKLSDFVKERLDSLASMYYFKHDAMYEFRNFALMRTFNFPGLFWKFLADSNFDLVNNYVDLAHLAEKYNGEKGNMEFWKIYGNEGTDLFEGESTGFEANFLKLTGFLPSREFQLKQKDKYIEVSKICRAGIKISNNNDAFKLLTPLLSKETLLQKLIRLLRSRRIK